MSIHHYTKITRTTCGGILRRSLCHFPLRPSPVSIRIALITGSTTQTWTRSSWTVHTGRCAADFCVCKCVYCKLIKHQYFKALSRQNILFICVCVHACIHMSMCVCYSGFLKTSYECRCVRDFKSLPAKDVFLAAWMISVDNIVIFSVLSTIQTCRLRFLRHAHWSARALSSIITGLLVHMINGASHIFLRASAHINTGFRRISSLWVHMIECCQPTMPTGREVALTPRGKRVCVCVCVCVCAHIYQSAVLKNP
jgi:hypothetical protein